MGGLDSTSLQAAGMSTHTAQALAITGRATLQGALQELLGGRFRDGFSAGLASGLAAEITSALNAEIAAAKGLSTAELSALHTLSRATGSAIAALANPSDPGFAFAQEFLGSLIADSLQEAASPAVGSSQPQPAPPGFLAFDDDGNLMPGVVDPALPPVEQALQLAEHLRRQGFRPEEAAELALDAIPLASTSVLLPPSAESASWTDDERQRRIEDVERQVLADLAAQEARDDSLLDADDLASDAGGGGGRPPVRPVLNGRFDSALNGAADAAGLIDPIRALQSDISHLRGLQAESAIDTMRAAMRGAGMPNIGDGFERAWDASGNMVRDYGATVQRLEEAYRGFVEDRRLTQAWGEDWQSRRIGRSQMTVQQFETRVLSLQQQAADDAYNRGVQAIANGNLPLRNGDYALTLGGYVDGQVRLDLRDFGRSEGIPDSSASNVFAVNRYLRGEGMVGVPDLRLGANLISDVSLARKDAFTQQLRRWNVIQPNDTLIVRPSQLGGSYVVPGSTIQPLVQPRRGG